MVKIELKGKKEHLEIFAKEIEEKFKQEYDKAIDEMKEELKKRGIDPDSLKFDYTIKATVKGDKLIVETDYPEKINELVFKNIFKISIAHKMISGALKNLVAKKMKEALINVAKKKGYEIKA